MLAIFALMTRCGLNVPLFTVVRHARLTPSQEARNMVGQGASLDAILEVTDYVARMREEQGAGKGAGGTGKGAGGTGKGAGGTGAGKGAGVQHKLFCASSADSLAAR